MYMQAVSFVYVWYTGELSGEMWQVSYISMIWQHNACNHDLIPYPIANFKCRDQDENSIYLVPTNMPWLNTVGKGVF